MNDQKKSPGCRVCGSEEVETWFHPREMMFGMREEFPYFKCLHCQCLQLEALPEDINKYYPSDYYSFRQVTETSQSLKASIKRRLISPMMSRSILGWGSHYGRILCLLMRSPNIPKWMHVLPGAIPFDSRILDVGCGSGEALLTLQNCGFTNLHGVDPYIPKNLFYKNGLQIRKCELSAIKDKFRLIMFHHVFEHLENPLETLKKAGELLEPNGYIIVRIPLSDSHAAEHYGEKWVQFDAPRHVTLQTRKSMQILAEKAQLEISRVVYDSSYFQFWGSELYIQDIPLKDPRSQMVESGNGLFSSKTLMEYALKASTLNLEERGDQAAFVLSARKK